MRAPPPRQPPRSRFRSRHEERQSRQCGSPRPSQRRQAPTQSCAPERHKPARPHFGSAGLGSARRGYAAVGRLAPLGQDRAKVRRQAGAAHHSDPAVTSQGRRAEHRPCGGRKIKTVAAEVSEISVRSVRCVRLFRKPYPYSGDALPPKFQTFREVSAFRAGNGSDRHAGAKSVHRHT